MVTVFCSQKEDAEDLCDFLVLRGYRTATVDHTIKLVGHGIPNGPNGEVYY